MTWTTDNRWAPGASGANVPDDAPAAYSARWIDLGDYARADILADRQGFAYNDDDDREWLIGLLNESDGLLRYPRMRRDVTTYVVNESTLWRCAQRRSGGYIYVDAWLLP